MLIGRPLNLNKFKQRATTPTLIYVQLTTKRPHTTRTRPSYYTTGLASLYLSRLFALPRTFFRSSKTTMRFFASSSRAALLLAAAAAAFCLTAARAHITVQDNFLDEAAREDILAQLPAQARFKHTLDVPGQLYQRLLSVLHPTNTDLSLTETSVPTKGEGRLVPAHKDVFGDSSMTEGPVGLVYLEGDGRMLFQHDVTGEETVVDVQPGRLLSWDNRVYTHTLIPGNMPRRILGPMAFRDGGMQSIGDPTPRVLAQAYAHSLSVRAGGIAKVTLNFVVLDVEGGVNGRKRAMRNLDSLDLVIGVRKRRREGGEGGRGGREEYVYIFGWWLLPFLVTLNRHFHFIIAKSRHSSRLLFLFTPPSLHPSLPPLSPPSLPPSLQCNIGDVSDRAIGTNKAGTAEEIIFKSSKITPNSFKPRYLPSLPPSLPSSLLPFLPPSLPSSLLPFLPPSLPPPQADLRGSQ